jgi:flavin reductase (DIM6/NTAB) family NADH-FMN oxidoreductase RutF
MVWLSKRNETHEVARSASVLAVHVPRAEDHALAELFGGETGWERDKFADVAWRPGPEGVPLLDDCDQWFVGTVLSRHDTGDHEGFLLAPVAASETHGAPQLPFQQVRDLPPGNLP